MPFGTWTRNAVGVGVRRHANGQDRSGCAARKRTGNINLGTLKALHDGRGNPAFDLDRLTAHDGGAAHRLAREGYRRAGHGLRSRRERDQHLRFPGCRKRHAGRPLAG